MKDEPTYDPKNPYKIAYNYFRNDPSISNTGADYIGKTTYKFKTFTSFAHKISGIITAIGSNEIAIKELIEYPHDVSVGFEDLGKNQMIPLLYCSHLTNRLF